jgi:glycosyltransferase involved in cell wall biosynthesis
MQLLMFNLATDPGHPALGFTTTWIRALAERATSVDVITMTAKAAVLPSNVRVFSVGREWGYSEARRALRFYRLLAGLVLRRPPDACFAHMMPLFAAMAAPVLRPLGIPVVTWYAHPSQTLTLRLAHHLSSAMLTSVAGAYPYRHDEKVHAIGQGIDGRHFTPGGQQGVRDAGLVLCAGRISRSKRLHVLLRAVARLHASGQFKGRRLIFLGRPISEDDRQYRHELAAMVLRWALGEVVTFEGRATYEQMPVWYRRAAVHVNLTPAGFGDKVALEAMACATPSILANESFADVLGSHRERLLFPVDDDVALAQRINRLLRMEPSDRLMLGVGLRERVLERHSLGRLGDEILRLLKDSSGSRS